MTVCLTSNFWDNPVSQYQKHFILDFIGAKDDGDGGDNFAAISRAKLQPNHHHQQINSYNNCYFMHKLQHNLQQTYAHVPGTLCHRASGLSSLNVFQEDLKTEQDDWTRLLPLTLITDTRELYSCSVSLQQLSVIASL